MVYRDTSLLLLDMDSRCLMLFPMMVSLIHTVHNTNCACNECFAGSNRTQSPHEPMLNLSMAHSGVINHMEFLYKKYNLSLLNYCCIIILYANSSLLLTASTDGTVRLWGSPIPFSHHTSIGNNTVRYIIHNSMTTTISKCA